MRTTRFVALFAVLLSVPAAAQTWTRAHGGADNAGFADVDTAAVGPGTTTKIVTGLGRFAPGSGPVIGTDGTAYVGTLEGELKAISAAGGVLWTKRLEPRDRIIASPLVGSDGAIYVVGVEGPLRDRRNGQDLYVTNSHLYRFAADGTLVWRTSFPQHTTTRIAGSGVSAAPPNAIGSGVTETILVSVQIPKVISNSTGQPTLQETHILGFLGNGQVLFDETMLFEYPTIRGVQGFPCLTVDCWFGLERDPPRPSRVAAGPDKIPGDATAPIATVVVAPGNIIVGTDGISGVRGFSYQPGTSSAALTKVFDKVDARLITSSIAALPDGRTVYAVREGRIAFSGPSLDRVADIRHAASGQSTVQASPTRLADGRVVTIDREGGVTIVESVTPIRRHPVRAQTIAAASASRTFFYVSAADDLVTFNASTLDEVSRYPWTGGGLSSPAIGADGLIYAIAGGSLYIFSATNLPRCGPGGPRGNAAVPCGPGPIRENR